MPAKSPPAGLFNVMGTSLMLIKTFFGGISVAADRALEGPLPRVLPLVRNEPGLVLKHPAAEAALELGILVVVLDVRLESVGVGKPLPAVPAVVLLVSAVRQCDVFPQMRLPLEDLMALLTFVLLVLMLRLDVEQEILLVREALVALVAVVE